jgi:hypothetical protein
MEGHPPIGEVTVGRLFIHGRLGDATTGGPLYCRVIAVDSRLVTDETLYRRQDGSVRIGSPWQLLVDGFLEIVGAWSDEDNPPPVGRGRALVNRYRCRQRRSAGDRRGRRDSDQRPRRSGSRGRREKPTGWGELTLGRPRERRRARAGRPAEVARRMGDRWHQPCSGG